MDSTLTLHGTAVLRMWFAFGLDALRIAVALPFTALQFNAFRRRHCGAGGIS